MSVDGQTIPEIAAYRAASPLFPVLLPPNNVLGVPAGVTPAVADGYQIMVPPLAAGEHEIVGHLELTDDTVLPDQVLLVTVLGPTVAKHAATPISGSPVATPVA